ncbi:MAG: BadF/BadG/BcrA/BcrD ATPase family protein [Xanthobacteraceae bacterium]
MSLPLFLGVDGGGTKTRFVLVDRDGNLLASQQGPGSYHLEIGMDGLRAVLAEGLAALFGQAGIDGGAIAHAFFGIPAYGEDSVAQPLLDAMPEPLLGHRRYRCGNDMVCAWAGSLGGEDGINVVAGTGSIGYGERRGKSARAGGWGEVFGDEGSAYWIAVQGLNIFTRMSDGRLPKGPLHAAFRASFGLSADLDLCAKVLNEHTRGSIAAMSELVTRAARDGDPSAVHIFDDAARELAAVVEAVRQALEFAPGEGVPVSYSGGVFNAGPLILGPFERHLARQSGSYRLQAPIVTPSGGAAIYAAKLAAQPLSVAAIERLAGGLRADVGNRKMTSR